MDNADFLANSHLNWILGDGKLLPRCSYYAMLTHALQGRFDLVKIDEHIVSALVDRVRGVRPFNSRRN